MPVYRIREESLPMPDPLTPERENARLWQALERIAWHELSGLEARDIARAVLDDAEAENKRLREELVENEAVWKAWRRRAGEAEAERDRFQAGLLGIVAEHACEWNRCSDPICAVVQIARAALNPG